VVAFFAVVDLRARDRGALTSVETYSTFRPLASWIRRTAVVCLQAPLPTPREVRNTLARFLAEGPLGRPLVGWVHGGLHSPLSVHEGWT
jgi:hypothetical protein